MARQYESTHSHLTFKLKLSGRNPFLWIALGECQSKCEHIARVPLRPETARELNRLFLVKGVLATTAIEGNTLSEEEVEQHLAGTLQLPPSRQYLGDEVDRIVEACQGILNELLVGPMPPLTVERIMQLNGQVLRDLEVGEDVVPGQLRTLPVGVGRYRGAPAEDCDYLLQTLCDWLNSDAFRAPDESLTIVYAVIKAVIAHLYIAWIHPFGDGNGRTARLLEFQILVGAGVPAACTHLLSNHYNQTRSRYYHELDKATASGGETEPFLQYAVNGFLDGLRGQLETIWEQQHDVTWRSYVTEHFRRDGHRRNGERRRDLVLDLSHQRGPVPREGIRHISARVAEAYAKKGERTLDRDLDYLLKQDLIVKTEKGYAPNREVIYAFLTPRAPHR